MRSRPLLTVLLALTFITAFGIPIYELASWFESRRQAAILSGRIGRMHQLLVAINTYQAQSSSQLVNATPEFETLSWRVHLSAFVGSLAISKEYAREQPWNSPRNLPYLTDCPKFFSGESQSQFSQILLVTPRHSEVRADGPPIDQESPWWMLTESEHFRVPWTRPNDVTVQEVVATFNQLLGSYKLSGNESVVVLRPGATPEIEAITVTRLLARLSPPESEAK